MAEAILLKQGGGGTGSDECTALREHVLASYTAVTKDSDDESAEGTMPNRGAVSQTLNAGDSYMVPAGYHNGSGKVVANSLASQTSATAGSGDILSGKTAYVNGNKITGAMPDRGAVSQALNAGGSYTVPAGYHSGSGKITANSLASQTGGATAGDGDVLTGKTYWKDGAKRTGSLTNQGTKTSALNCGGSYTIPAGYHNGGGKVTANSLSSQTGANSAAGDIRSGKTAWVNGAKLTGTLAVTSAISFSAAALSYNTIRISWKNPAKGPWQGVFIQVSTSGYPGTGGGSRAYTGAGNNPNQAGGSNYVDIGGLTPNTLYYFTCTSYCDALGWGTSYNVNYRTLYYDLYNNGSNIVSYEMDYYCSLTSNGYINIPKITANQPMSPAYFYSSTQIDFSRCSYFCVDWLNNHTYATSPHFTVLFKTGTYTKSARTTSGRIESGSRSIIKIPLDDLKGDTNFNSMTADYHKISIWDDTGESYGETTYSIYAKKVYRIWME